MTPQQICIFVFCGSVIFAFGFVLGKCYAEYIARELCRNCNLRTGARA